MDRGLVRLVERQDPALAALLADDRRTARHSTAAGDRYLVVPASSEAASRHDLRDLEYCAISGIAWHRATSRAHRGAGAHTGSQLLGSSIHGNDVTLREQHEACPREGLPVTAKGVGIVISGAGHEHTDLRGRPRAHRPQRPAPTSTPTSGAGHEHMATGRDPDRQQAARQGGGSHAGGARAQRTGGAVCATAGGRSSCCASHTCELVADATWLEREADFEAFLSAPSVAGDAC